MTEFEKQTAKEGFQSANAEYKGLAAKPITGEKNGNKWTKLKVLFHIEGKTKENKFDMWLPIKSDKSKYKDIEDLKQFDMYNIVWTEKEESYNGNEWVSKTIVVINDPKEETNNTQPTMNKAPAQKKVELTEEKIQELLAQINNENIEKGKEENNKKYASVVAKLYSILHKEEWLLVHPFVKEFIKENTETEDGPTERKELGEEVVQ